MILSADVVVLSVLLIWISKEDAQDFIISDRVITLGLLAVVGFSLLGTVAARRSLLGLLFGVSQFGLVYLLLPGRLGLGDVKLAALIGAFLGPLGWFATAIGSTFLALGLNLSSLRWHTGKSEERIPLAPYLGCSALIVRISMGAGL